MSIESELKQLNANLTDYIAAYRERTELVRQSVITPSKPADKKSVPEQNKTAEVAEKSTKAGLAEKTKPATPAPAQAQPTPAAAPQTTDPRQEPSEEVVDEVAEFNQRVDLCNQLFGVLVNECGLSKVEAKGIVAKTKNAYFGTPTQVKDIPHSSHEGFCTYMLNQIEDMRNCNGM